MLGPLFIPTVYNVSRSHSVVNRPSLVVNRPSFVVNRPLLVVNRSSSVVNQPSFVVNRPSFVVNRPSLHMDQVDKTLRLTHERLWYGPSRRTCLHVGEAVELRCVIDMGGRLTLPRRAAVV
jgi:hypothetical protein